MNPYGGGQPMQPGSVSGSPGGPKDNFRGFGNQAELDAYRKQRGELLQDSNYKDGIAGQLSQMQGQARGMSLNDFQGGAQDNRSPEARAAEEAARGFRAPPMQRPTPGNMPGQAPSMPPGFTTYPMQMSQEDLVKRYPPGTQIPGLQQFGPGAAVGKDPSVYAGNRGPDYFRGQGMDMGKFNQPGYQAPQRQVQGNQIAGGGTTMDRFSRPGYTAPQRNVAGDQIRGGGSPGLSRRRVNTDPNRRGQPAGVLAPIPR
jgi:hypothetical protein